MNKKKDKKASPAGLIIVLIFFLISFLDSTGSNGLIFGIIIAAVLTYVFIKALKKDAQAKSKETSDTPVSRVPPVSPGKVLTQAKVSDEFAHCDDEHYIRLTPDERRSEQLKSMLKAGIIDREEYAILLQRWGLG